MSVVKEESGSPVVHIEDVGEFVAALPALLGHYPISSLVAAYIRGGRLARLVCMELRAAELARRCVELVGTVQPETVVLVAVDGCTELRFEGSPVLGICRAMEGAGVRVSHTLWARHICLGAPWASYRDRTLFGTLPDPALVVPARIAVATGRSIYPDRPAAADEPVPDELDEKRAAAIRRSPFIKREMTFQTRISRVEKALSTAARGHYPLTNQSVGLLAAALADERVRDSVVNPL